MPLTSIIITTHSRPQLLQRAIESARQAGTQIEVVVVDDGSTDETSAVCRSIPDIVYLRLDQRRGVGYARVRGIDASTGTYVSFLDDDDARLPGSIDRQLAILEANPGAALVYGQIYLATQKLEVDPRRLFPNVCSGGDVFWSLLSGSFSLPSGSVVVRRSAIDAVGGLCPEVAPADDWDLWLRITERSPVVALSEPVSVYRQPTLWSEQGSSRWADRLMPANMIVLERCAKLPRAMADPRAFRRSVRGLKNVICRRLMRETFEALRRRDSYALVSLRHAISAAPGAFLQTIISPSNWQKLRERVAT